MLKNCELGCVCCVFRTVGVANHNLQFSHTQAHMNTSPLGQQTLQTLTLTSYHVCINHRAAQLLQVARHQCFTTGYAARQTENEHVVSVRVVSAQ